VSAGLRIPQGVAVDLTNNVFIADAGNSMIRKVTPAGLISSVFGGGFEVAVDAGGDLFATDPGAVYELTASGSSRKIAGQPALVSVKGVAVDTGGNVIVADPASNLIHKITPDGTVHTVAEMAEQVSRGMADRR